MTEDRPIPADTLPTKSARRLLAWATGPCVPAWTVLVVLALLGELDWIEAAIASAAVFVLMAIMVFSRLADFDRLARYAEALFDNPDLPPPQVETSETVMRLVTAINALRKLWADRRDEANALAKSRQDILDSLPEPLLLLDKRRRVLSDNAAARELFDHELPGRDLAGVIRDPKVLDAADLALTQNRKTEAQFTLPAPVERTFGALMVPLKDTAGEIIGLILALDDQTERLKMDRMRADFVANASHELRTPLASVLGFIETLRGPAKDDPAAREEFLEIMLKQANRMTRLIDDLLSLSRIELREHTRPTEAVDMGELLHNAAELLERQARDRGTIINVAVIGDLPPALGDAGEISQVFHNLITNAVKYGGERGPVDVTAMTSETRPPAMPGRGPCLKITVRDQGEGIPKEHIPRLTERFYRVDTARSRILGGTGLGLAIVKHITNRHRGALVIESDIGKGSTFTVYLPIAPPGTKAA